MKGIKDLEAYDIYIFKTNGLPLLGGCTGSNYCMNHLPNHELHTAFMAALQSFSIEAFLNNTVKTIVMDEFQLNMRVVSEKDFIFASVHPSDVETDKIRSLIEEGANLFIEKFGDKIGATILSTQTFEGFSDDLMNLKLIPGRKMRSVLPLKEKKDIILKIKKKEKKSWLSKILRK